MSYYFKNKDGEQSNKITLPTVDYPAQKAAFLAKLGEGISSKKRASVLRDELNKTADMAREVMKDANREELQLIRAYEVELDKASKASDSKYKETLEKARAVQDESYIDPSYTPELEAKVNALALSYIGELSGMNGQEARKNELFNRALATREGSMALLRLPTPFLPSRIQSQAAKKAKSPAEVVFDRERQARLDQLNAQCYNLYSEGFHYRNIAQKMKMREQGLVKVIAEGEAKAI